MDNQGNDIVKKLDKIKIDLTGVTIPKNDGDENLYCYKEAKKNRQFFNDRRTVVFINGMNNTGKEHATSALALSWVQMCNVIGVYNATDGGLNDLIQCLGDKDQFNGIFSKSAKNKITGGNQRTTEVSADAARNALSRNHAQVALFDVLRRKENAKLEIFAHSQGNLILSNVLQAIAAVDGPAALTGRIVHTFGSPSINWPTGIKKFEHGFTWDPVTWLSGFDSSWSISKVGMPTGSMNPITHGFLEYMKQDAAFIVNRFRWGSLGVTINMDEDGLATSLAAMKKNTGRVYEVFEHLNVHHNSDVDDVAVRYVKLVKRAPGVPQAIKSHKKLLPFLIRMMDEGWTSTEEKNAISFLKSI